MASEFKRILRPHLGVRGVRSSHQAQRVIEGDSAGGRRDVPDVQFPKRRVRCGFCVEVQKPQIFLFLLLFLGAKKDYLVLTLEVELHKWKSVGVCAQNDRSMITTYSLGSDLNSPSGLREHKLKLYIWVDSVGGGSMKSNIYATDSGTDPKSDLDDAAEDVQLRTIKPRKLDSGLDTIF
ncbi:hypothetical protein B0H19DRAFT_1059960 [Mycena capillaripes]|nr:hypothetical protein B0H19DRAFT_1059960 [Mycena capillaripes]